MASAVTGIETKPVLKVDLVEDTGITCIGNRKANILRQHKQ